MFKGIIEKGMAVAKNVYSKACDLVSSAAEGVKNIIVPVVGAGAAVVGSVAASHAGILEDTKTAVEAAAADALTVGGYVVAGVCSLLVIGLIIMCVRKLR